MWFWIAVGLWLLGHRQGWWRDMAAKGNNDTLFACRFLITVRDFDRWPASMRAIVPADEEDPVDWLIRQLYARMKDAGEDFIGEHSGGFVGKVRAS